MAQFGNRPYTAEEAAAAFWAKVDKRDPAECWPWTGAVTTHGYGSVKFQHRYRGAHRLAYILTNGEPAKGIQVLHRCDNRLCCNPAHHFLGTLADNMRDMVEKGRKATKLTPEDVREIRRLCAAPKYRGRIKEVSQRFGISPSQVITIRNRKQWEHIE